MTHLQKHVRAALTAAEAVAGAAGVDVHLATGGRTPRLVFRKGTAERRLTIHNGTSEATHVAQATAARARRVVQELA